LIYQSPIMICIKRFHRESSMNIINFFSP